METSEDSEEDKSSCEDSGTSSDEYETNWIEAATTCLHSSTDLTSKNAEIHAPKRKRRRGWKKKTKMPYSSSMFYRDYHNPHVRDLNHVDAKEFRLNYRMPWIWANKILRIFVERGWVLTDAIPKPTTVVRQIVCPPEIKILGVLYWLGEGCSFRTIYNLSGRVLSRVSFTNFAKKFCSCLRHHLAHEWIKFPTSTAELSSISAEYAKKGFPGCCGSTDGVQIPWEGCPYAYRSSFSGKEGYPTLGFNVTVAHDLRILHVCSMFAGRFNDKTKVLYDDYVSYLRSGSHDHFEYHTFNLDGERTHQTTPYLICDCGYHRWVQLMCPFKTTSKKMLALWSKRLESIRKDVERAFGVLKKRFRVLKVPTQFREASFVESIFIACCVLHNMLLHHDKQFQDGNFRVGVATNLPRHRRRTILINNVRRLLKQNDDFSVCGGCSGFTDQTITEIDSAFNSMRHELAAHTYYLFLRNELIR